MSTINQSQGGSYTSKGLYIDKDRNLKLDDVLVSTAVPTRFITGFLIIKDI